MLPVARSDLEQAASFLKMGTDHMDEVTGGHLNAGFSSLVRAVTNLIEEVRKHEAAIEELKAGSH
jgi:hypothetical protein